MPTEFHGHFLFSTMLYCKYILKISNENLEAKVGNESGFPQIENDVIVDELKT